MAWNRHFGLRSRAAPPLIPLATVGAGRTGSTLLLELLGTSPAVLVDTEYPHEDFRVSAAALCAIALAKAPDALPEDARNALPLLRERLRIRETGPWADEGAEDHTDSLWRRLLRANWEILSDHARARSPEARYVAEKSGPALPWILQSAGLPCRYVVRIRDLRDVWCSVDAFNRRRGHEMDSPDTPLRPADERLPLFVERMKTLYRPFVEAPLPEHARLVHYEALVGDLPGVASALGDWLGVSLDADLALRRAGAYPQHRTVASGDESVGRWRQDMDPRHGAVIERELGDILGRFGYA